MKVVIAGLFLLVSLSAVFLTPSHFKDFQKTLISSKTLSVLTVSRSCKRNSVDAFSRKTASSTRCLPD